MAKMYVIQTAQTTWDEQSRMESAPGAPLTATGEQAVCDAARELAPVGIATVYCSAGQAERQTAEMAVEILGAKLRVKEELRELDYGLWQGLTADEIRHRQPRLFRQWQDSPASTCPSGGETLQEARLRLCKAVREILKRRKNARVLIVLRPVVLGVLKCTVLQEPLESLWTHVQPGCRWELLDADENVLSGS